MNDSNIESSDKLLRVASESLAGDQSAKAVEACSALNHHYPEFAPGWAVGSQVALKLNDAEKALEFIDRALALNAESAHFHIYRAQCLLALKRISDAVAAALRLAVKATGTVRSIGVGCAQVAGLECTDIDNAIATAASATGGVEHTRRRIAAQSG